MSRVILGFAAAIIAPALVLGAATLNLGSVVVGLVYSLPATLFIGVPYYEFLRKRSTLQWWRCGVAGGVAGMACALFFIPMGLGAVQIAFVVAVSLGTMSGLIFWAIACRGVSPGQGTQPRLTSEQ
jgi:hypothetical protein